MTRSVKLLAGIIPALLATSFTVQADSIDHEVTENLSLNASGIKLMEIDASAGFLKVKGDPDADSIEVVADLMVVKDAYELSLTKRGDRAVLLADANTDGWSSWGGDSPRIDLTVVVPQSFALRIDDGSGFIEVENIGGKLKIKDGSGEITAVDLGADADINDGSGSLTLENVAGNIIVDDGSGGITINKVGGSVEIEDGSGSIEVVDVGGTVDVDDGSGHLLVEKANGHVTIDDGSGGIEVRELENGLTIVNAGSGGLSIKDVKGDVNTK